MSFELPVVDRCVFCETLAGRLDKGVVEETEHTLTLVGNRQFEEGQLLVVPRRHAATLLDLSDAEAAAVMDAARRAARALVAAFRPDGLTLYQNNGVVSLQEVPHFHLHVVPRRRGSGWGEGPPHIAPLERRPRRDVEITPARERELAALIRRYLA